MAISSETSALGNPDNGRSLKDDEHMSLSNLELGDSINVSLEPGDKVFAVVTKDFVRRSLIVWTDTTDSNGAKTYLPTVLKKGKNYSVGISDSSNIRIDPQKNIGVNPYVSREHFTINSDAEGNFEIVNFTPTNGTNLQIIKPGCVERPIKIESSRLSSPHKLGEDGVLLQSNNGTLRIQKSQDNKTGERKVQIFDTKGTLIAQVKEYFYDEDGPPSCVRIGRSENSLTIAGEKDHLNIDSKLYFRFNPSAVVFAVENSSTASLTLSSVDSKN